MHLDTASNATQLLGAVNGVYIAGALIGSILSSYATDALGRRKSLSMTSALATVGGILQAGSVNMAMFIAARLIAGLGIGSSLPPLLDGERLLTLTGAIFALIPLFQSEIAPPTARGLLVGTHGIMISLGTVLPKYDGSSPGDSSPQADNVAAGLDSAFTTSMRAVRNGDRR
jgi:MFS family permease